MSISRLEGVASSVAALTFLAGCGGSQPIGAPGAMSSTLAHAAHADRGTSWMARDSKKQDLLYVSAYDNSKYKGNHVYVYSYPEGKPEGELSGFSFPSGMCVDKSGDVFIVNYNGDDILEYAHGGTEPIATLQDLPDSYPLDCSIDPTTGDLAVTNSQGQSEHADIAIYAQAQGAPTIHSDPAMFSFGACAYDNEGNLFADGDSNTLKPELVELPKSNVAFINFPLKLRGWYGGGIQWNGEHIVLGARKGYIIYQLAASGGRLRSVRSTKLTDGNHVDFFSIVKFGDLKVGPKGTTLIGPDYDGANAKFWSYPAGGTSFKTISGIDQPVGTAVSPSSK